MHTPQTLHSIQFTIIPKMATLSPFPYTPSPFKTPNSKPILSPLHHSSFLPLRFRKLKTTSFTFKSFSSLKDENNNKGDAGRKTNEDDPFDIYLRKPSFKASLKASIKWDKMLNDCMLKELEEFEKSLRDPSFKASIMRDKMSNDSMLKEFEEFEEFLWDPSFGFLNNYIRRMLVREKERLQKAEETFTELDLNKLKSCFGIDTFFATDVRRFGDGGIFVGNLRRPIDEVIPKLEKKLSDAAGREVVLWFMEEEEEPYGINRQVCMVQPKAELDLQLESTSLSNPFGYLSSIALAVTTFGTVGSMGVSFLNATFGDYLASVVPLFGGFLIILGVSEIATRVTAARYGVKLSPSFLVPSIWTGCFGVMNNYESLLPNKKALFDISVARTASAYLTSLALAVAGFVAHGSFNGGDNALYIRPEFFDNNPLLSFIQLVIVPYTDDLGIVLPYAVKGVGVPVDPLAFAGLLGMVVTSLNLLPLWQLEGGRIAQAMFRRRSTAILLSLGSILLLGIGGLRGSVLCLTWGLFAIIFRGGEEIPAKDEITPLGESRYTWGIFLGLICILTLFPNIGGTFSNSFLSAFFRG